MRLCRLAAVAAVLLLANGHEDASEAASLISLQRDGSVEIGARRLRCGSVRSTLDRRLPNLGIAIPDLRLLVINPTLLQRYPEVVRLFVFNHECGHHHVGGSELKADCWAVDRGVREGWLDKAGLAQVCRSFGNVVRTPTHPSAANRCGNLERCFASAAASLASSRPPVPQPASVETPASAKPTLISGPRLLRDGLEP